MQLEEIREKKTQLERGIVQLIRKFQDDTGLIVSRLALDTETEKNSSGQKQVTSQRVRAGIKL